MTAGVAMGFGRTPAQTVERDIPDIAVIERGARLPDFLEALALINGQRVNLTELFTRIGADRKTAERYLSLLENLFIIVRLPAWSRSGLQPLARRPNLHFVDRGMATARPGSTGRSDFLTISTRMVSKLSS